MILFVYLFTAALYKLIVYSIKCTLSLYLYFQPSLIQCQDRFRPGDSQWIFLLNCILLKLSKAWQGTSYLRERLSTVDLLVITILDEPIFIMKILFTFVTKRTTLMRRSTVLSLPPSVSIPWLHIVGFYIAIFILKFFPQRGGWLPGHTAPFNHLNLTIPVWYQGNLTEGEAKYSWPPCTY